MILQRLCEYYDRLMADPTQEIAAPGFAPQQISFQVVITPEGKLHDIQDVRDQTGKKPMPRKMVLPYCGKRSSGIQAMFLWDKAEYLLGWIPKELSDEPEGETEADAKKRQKKRERVPLCFEATKTQHSQIAGEIDDPHLQLVSRFLDTWDPSLLTDQQRLLLEEIGAGFGVFQIQGEKKGVHESKQITDFWSSRTPGGGATTETGTCLVTGLEGALARLHPVVKGVAGAQSSGASIVSFNGDAFTSYGMVQSFNAPVSELAAFKYTTALNRLLRRDGGRKIQVGDTACVFWAENTTVSETLFQFAMDPGQFEDQDRAKEIGNLLARIANGESETPDAGTPFYVLGLAPNASRLSVRFWLSSTAGETLQHVVKHQRQLTIVKGPKDPLSLPLWLILAQTAREAKEIPPLLGGSLIRSVLSDSRYPEQLFTTVLRRVRAEQEIRYAKAAIIKAILSRNYDLDIPIMLDPERTESAYLLGRLFASIERTQEDALPGINATVKDRYFGSASATPAVVFPRLIRMSQHHVNKLEGGKKVVAEKRLQEIMAHLTSFPSHLGLVDQGLFAIGYYHQRQFFFTPKSKPKS